MAAKILSEVPQSSKGGFGKRTHNWTELLNLDGATRFVVPLGKDGKLIKHFAYQSRKMFDQFARGNGKSGARHGYDDNTLSVQCFKHKDGETEGYAIRLLKDGKLFGESAKAVENKGKPVGGKKV